MGFNLPQKHRIPAPSEASIARRKAADKLRAEKQASREKQDWYQVQLKLKQWIVSWKLGRHIERAG